MSDERSPLDLEGLKRHRLHAYGEAEVYWGQRQDAILAALERAEELDRECDRLGSLLADEERMRKAAQRHGGLLMERAGRVEAALEADNAYKVKLERDITRLERVEAAARDARQALEDGEPGFALSRLRAALAPAPAEAMSSEREGGDG
jgi:hypothetical protein